MEKISYIHLFIYEVKGPDKKSYPRDPNEFEPESKISVYKLDDYNKRIFYQYTPTPSKVTQYINYTPYSIRNIPYSFNELSIKKKNENTLIVPKEIKDKSSNKSLLFSKDIIKNKNSNNKISNKDLNNNLPFLYKLYTSLPARIYTDYILDISKNKGFKNKLNDIYVKLNKLIKDNTIILKNYLKKNSAYKDDKNISELKNKSEIIYNLFENEKKIIIIGDNHGSFHSFFRIILRLYIKKIIRPGYKLKDNYKLILLGDILDRGNYATEILFILFNLMVNNNTEDNLNVIIIRGNHEVEDQYGHYFFQNELKIKLKSIPDYNIKKTEDLITEFFKFCPSAIILKHFNTRYWLCHGGFPINFIKKESFLSQFFKKNKSIEQNINIEPDITYIDDIIYKKISLKIKNKNNDNFIYVNNQDNLSSEIRWNDFNTINNSVCSHRNPDYSFYDRTKLNCKIKVIGRTDLLNFLEYLDIDFIIRGHSDDYSNAMLLCENNASSIPFFYLNKKENMEYYNNSGNKTNILTYKYNDNDKKCDNEIVTINPKNFKKTESKVKDKKLFPVLTISNNCDKGRMLYSDCFIILDPDKDKVIFKKTNRSTLTTLNKSNIALNNSNIANYNYRNSNNKNDDNYNYNNELNKDLDENTYEKLKENFKSSSTVFNKNLNSSFFV